MSIRTGSVARYQAPPLEMGATAPAAGNRVLVPVIRGQSAGSLLAIGDAIARQCPSRGVILSLVEIPARWTGLVTSAVVRSRELLRWIAASDHERAEAGQRMSIQSRFTSDASASIREALLETQSDVVLAEWPSDGAARKYRLAAILRTLAADLDVNLVVARPDPAAAGGRFYPRSLLVPLRGGANAWFALGVAMAISSDADVQPTLLHVYDRNHHHDRQRQEEATFHQLVEAAEAAQPRVIELFSKSPAEVILKTGAHYDTVVLGAHANPTRAAALLGNDLSPTMARLTKTVILARASGRPAQAA
jgi:nucleotide-binding universal stress UspA family protein